MLNIKIESNNQDKKRINSFYNKDYIEVYIDINYPPYIFVDEDGVLTGFLVDLWKLWEKENNIKVEIKAFNWDEALTRFKNGEGDVIDTIFFNPERAKWLTYSNPYEKIEVPIYYHKSITGINSIKALRGFSIAVKAGDNVINFLKNNGIKDLHYYSSYEDIIKEAKFGNVKIFSIDGPPAVYYLIKYNIYQDFKLGPILYTGQFHRAVRKGNEQLLNLIEDGFKNIDKNKITELRKKWFGVQLLSFNYIRIIFFVLIGFLIVFLILLLTSLILKKEVDSRTKNLRDTLRELENEKEKLKLLLNSIPEIFIIFNKNLDIEYIHIPEIYKNIKKTDNFNYENLIKRLIEDKDIKDSIILIFNSNYENIEKIKDIIFNNEKFYFSVKVFPFKYHFEEESYKIFDNKKESIPSQKLSIKKMLSSVIVYLQDITDIKRMEETLMKAQKFQMIGNLAGGIAHDFNNILHGISGIASLMKIDLEENENINKNDLIENIEIIEKSISKGSGIVNQILELSRETKSSGEFIDLNSVINSSIAIVAPSIDKTVKIKFEPYYDKAIVKGDKIKLEQVFINLILNANDAMTVMRKDDKIGGNIFIKVEKVKRNNLENFLISIKDEGVGIPEEYKDKIFDPFFTTKTDGKGTGLGLSIVYKIISSHNGYIDFYSNEGFGTTFYIYIPIYKGDFIFSDELIDEKKLVKGSGTILVVDDDETVLQATEKMLEKCGYDVIISKNGNDGYRAFIENENNLSLAIIDFIMPGLSGSELLRKIKDKNPDFKIIFATGYLEDEKLSEIKDIKFKFKDVIFINKPFDFIELSETIQELLQK
ncbi:MAG: transporter substrate-binding domain-containing protein [Spirochaetes bacterium]|nr:transporter substrate-binding domain-containing protein [Spirochaetota bacterium]